MNKQKSHVVHICNPSTGEIETGGSLGLTANQTTVLGQLQASERLSQKTKWIAL